MPVGAIRADQSAISISGYTWFMENASGNSGGAIYGGTLTIHISGETNFANNSAAYDGGAMVTYASVVNMTGYTSFEYNSAANSGGALAAPAGVTLFIGGITLFFENMAPWGGGAILVTSSKLRIDGSTSFFDNSAYDGGAILADQAPIHIDGNTSFSNNSAIHNGGGINVLGSNATIMGLVRFSSNTALNGGGLCSSLSHTVIFLGAISFVENTAVLDGGAISLAETTTLDVSGVSFVSNEAVCGGAISLRSTTGTTGLFERCRFDRNNASYGGAVYVSAGGTSDTQLLTFVQDSLFRHNVAHASGGALFNTGPLTIHDTVFSENTAAEGGLAIMNEESPLELGNVTFHGNMLSCVPEEYSDYDQVSSGHCRLQLVCEECLEGCGVDRRNATITSDTIPSCRAIPAGVSKSSPTTLETFDLLPGHYRVSVDSRYILKCYRKESCTGGDNALNYCATGYNGPYCAVCADGYSPGRLGHCHRCSTELRGYVVGLAAGALSLAIIVAVCLVSLSIRGAEDEGQLRCWRTITSSFKFAIKILPLPAIKIVVVVLQILCQFTEIAGAVYPDEYEAFLSRMTAINVDIGSILSNLCIVKTDFYDRLLISTLWPLVTLSALSGMSYIKRKRLRSTQIPETVVQEKFLATGLLVVFLVYSSVSFTIFQTFVCEDLDDGNAYLRADYSVKCWTEKHDAYITYASFMVLVYPVGIPAFFGWWLARNRRDFEELDRHETTRIQSFRGLWSAYKPSCCYYEVVECSRRALLTAAAVFVLPNSADQIAVVLLVMVIFMFVFESLSPFKSNHDMWLYRWGNVIIIVSMYAALLLKIDLAGADSRILMAVTAVLVAANVCMVTSVLVQVVKRICLYRRVEDVYNAPSSFV